MHVLGRGDGDMLTHPVATLVTEQQRRVLEQLVKERQLSLSAIVREAIRDYLAAAAAGR